MYQQARRWFHAKVFETIAHDLRMIARVLEDRQEQPSAAVFDARTLQSTPESGSRADYYETKKIGSKVHAAADTLGNLLALTITAANEQERAQVAELTEQIQKVTGGTIEVAYVDQGYTGNAAAKQARRSSIELEIVKHHEAKRGFVLLPRRWVVERIFGWLGRFRRLARDYERLTDTLNNWHWLAFLRLLMANIGIQSTLQALEDATIAPSFLPRDCRRAFDKAIACRQRLINTLSHDHRLAGRDDKESHQPDVGTLQCASRVALR